MVHVKVNENPMAETPPHTEDDAWVVPPSYKRLPFPQPSVITLSLPARCFHSVLVNNQHAGVMGLEEIPAGKITNPDAKACFLIGLWLHPGAQPHATIEAQALAQLAQIVARVPNHGLYAVVDVDDDHTAAVLGEAGFEQLLKLPAALGVLNKPVFRIGFDALD